MLPVQDAKSFQRAKLLEICEVEEQIMFNDKYAWLFSRQLEAIIFIIFQRAGKMFTNSFHFARGCLFFSFLQSGVPSSAAMDKWPIILNWI